ncbi:hypothetical protein [Halobacillus sp. Marseille-Q1614]|uniref:hypothetical protein n=1 Tax=Halobacillus sp. Marseille-Q1614 TaxID=2709134 RepID=UPI0015707652|nr:hypothetical protein [Halobacillus sp. Marseille-Q1614]
MKDWLILTLVLGSILTACSNDIENKGNEIIVQERIGETDQYIDLRKIDTVDQVDQVRDEIKDMKWENAVVSMNQPADFRFYFHEESKVSGLTYELWIGPSLETIELVYENKYVQLNEEKSSKLFEILIGEWSGS